jgi:hypothetical protein
MVQMVLFTGVKRLGYEVYHSPPSEVRLRMSGVMPLPHCMPSWHGQRLRKTNYIQGN